MSLNLTGALSLKEAAELVGLHPETLRRATRTGELPSTKLGHRTVRITRADLQAWYSAKGGRPLFSESTPAEPEAASKKAPAKKASNQ